MARVSTTDRVFADLRESIVTGVFPAGSLHSIYRLADLLEVSRTPVREAVLRLADLGLVTIERNRGVRIRGVSVADVRAVFELRLMLEVPATAFAAAHADASTVRSIQDELATMRKCAERGDEPGFMAHDRRLHQMIASTMANPRLLTELETLRDSIQSRGASTIDRSRGITEVADEHVPVVEAIVLQDPHAAAARMQEHLVHTATLLMRQVAETDDDVDETWANDLVQQLGAASRLDLPDRRPQ